MGSPGDERCRDLIILPPPRNNSTDKLDLSPLFFGAMAPAPSVSGGYFAYTTFSQDTPLKKSINNKKDPGHAFPKKGCVHGGRVYKGSSFGQKLQSSHRRLKIVLEGGASPCYHSLEPNSRHLQPHLPQCAAASLHSLHNPNQPHTWESWLQEAQLQGLVVYRMIHSYGFKL